MEGTIGEFPVEEMSTRKYTNRFGCAHLEDGRCGVSTDASGFFVPSTLSNVCQIPCGAGRRSKYSWQTQRPSDTGCFDCVAGKYNAEDDHYVGGTCPDCEVGTYSNAIAATSCTSCEKGLTTMPGSKLQSECYKNKCPDGSYGAEGAYPHDCDCVGMKCPDAASQPKLAHPFGGKPGFYHGVASGDPLPNSVIIWTRYTPTSATATVEIEYRMAEVTADSGMWITPDRLAD